MAADWPVLADVKALLRVDDTSDDDLIGTNLAAAIVWVTARCDPQWTDPAQPTFLPDPLFSVAQLEAGRLTRRRDSVDGTIGWGDMGVVRVGPKDPDIETLIAPYLAIVT
jgi:Phage gp6-like head-tail connector protein